MKVCICTTPIRPVPTSFPPFGSMAIIQSLREIGVDSQFFNIDYHRPSDDEVRNFFAEGKFDIVGISAVVSTAYAYTKKLAMWIREDLPQTTIIVGGNLAASAEILLRKSEVDYCIIGDGEKTIQNLVSYLGDEEASEDELLAVPGIAFIDKSNNFQLTGYAIPPAKNEISWPDYGILEEDGSLNHFITDGVGEEFYGMLSEMEGKGKRTAYVISTKGCVARCTFCHRWERGYRAKPTDQTIAHIEHLRDKYNVHFLSIADENFGSDRKLTEDLVSRLGAMGIRWRGAGVRVRSVKPETLHFWKENGCVAVFFGIESGSQKILDVMEKNATVEMNINALRWTYEAEIFTIIQLVIGMPGEDDRTISETIEFLKTVSPYLMLQGKMPSGMVSLNYAQALPGTPLYEYGRNHGSIGLDLQEEESYLLRISDTDAYNTDHFVNYTGQPLLKVRMWRPRIVAEIDADYLKKTHDLTMSVPRVIYTLCRYFSLWTLRLLKKKNRLFVNLDRFIEKLDQDPIRALLRRDETEAYSQSGYFNIKPAEFVFIFMNKTTRRFYYPLLAICIACRSAGSVIEIFRLIAEHFLWSLKLAFSPSAKKRYEKSPNQSLRKVVTVPDTDSEDQMIPLRLGR